MYYFGSCLLEDIRVVGSDRARAGWTITCTSGIGIDDTYFHTCEGDTVMLVYVVVADTDMGFIGTFSTLRRAQICQENALREWGTKSIIIESEVNEDGTQRQVTTESYE